ADVVRTVRVFARRHRRRAGRRLNANRTTQSRDGRDGRDRDKESSATCGSTHGWLYRPRCGAPSSMTVTAGFPMSPRRAFDADGGAQMPDCRQLSAPVDPAVVVQRSELSYLE